MRTVKRCAESSQHPQCLEEGDSGNSSHCILGYTFAPRYGVGASPDPRESGSICVLPLGWSRTHVGGQSPGWRDTPQRSLWVSSSAGAGAAGGGEGRDDTAAPLPVHTAAARDGHVQPKREFSTLGRGQRHPGGRWTRGSHGLCAMVAGYITATEESVLRVGRDSGLWATSWDGPQLPWTST